MTAFIGWQELMVVAAIPALIGGEVGIVLLVIGLVKRRKGLWVGGLATLIISVLLLASMAGFALLVFRGVSRPAPAVRPGPPASIGGSSAEDAAGIAKLGCGEAGVPAYGWTTYTSERPALAAVKEIHRPVGSARG